MIPSVNNALPLEEQIAELLDILTVVILQHPQGLSEHTLLSYLQKPPYYFFAPDALRDSLTLFQTHFLLFHCLYRLQARWLKSGRGKLTISALHIALQPITAKALSKDALATTDTLARYYLNLEHFTSTTREDVNILLSRAWKKRSNPVSSACLQRSLDLMELTPPFTLADLKAQYRRLAQRYHPDKGGDDEHFKHICQAYHQLKRQDLLNLGALS